MALQFNIPTLVNQTITNGVTAYAPSENAVFNALALKQDTLVSGINIKTVGGTSLLGIGNIPVGTGDALVANPLSQFAATTSAQLAGLISDETGSGSLVFNTSPTFLTNTTSPKTIGGTGTTSKHTIVGSTNTTPTSTSIAFDVMVGNNGATTALNIYHNGRAYLTGTSPSSGGVFTIKKASAASTAYGTPYLSIGIDDYASNQLQTIAFGYRIVDGNRSPAEFGLITSNTSGQTTGDFVWALRRAADVGTDAVPVEVMRLTHTGSLVTSKAALATTATDGFLYIPTCAGTPTGVPTTQTGTVAMVFDTTNNKLMIYDGGWLGATTPGAFV